MDRRGRGRPCQRGLELCGEFGDHLAAALNRGRVWGASALVAAALLIPVFSTTIAPLVDAPNHLARMHILAEGGNEMVRPRWVPLPNLAEDLLVPGPALLIGVERAQQAFIGLILGLSLVGTVLLHRAAHGGWRLWPLLGGLFAYHRSLLWGFLNYSFAVGLALIGAAAWLALERRPVARAVVGTGFALATMIAHIEGFVVYGAIVLGAELVPLWGLAVQRDWRGVAARLAVAIPQTVPPLLLLGLTWTPRPAIGWNWAGVLRKPDLLFGVVDNYDRPFDIACFAALLGLFVCLAATRRLRLEPRLGTALFLLLALYLGVPSELLTGAGADHRLPPALFLLLTAAASPVFPTIRLARGIGAAVALMLAARLAVIEAVWLAADQTFRRDEAILDEVPMGARIAVAYAGDAVNVGPCPEVHVPLLATVRRDAFVPTLFVFKDQQPLAFTPQGSSLAWRDDPLNLEDAFDRDGDDWHAARADLAPYDYLVLIARRARNWPARAGLTRLAATPTFALYRILPAALGRHDDDGDWRR